MKERRADSKYLNSFDAYTFVLYKMLSTFIQRSYDELITNVIHILMMLLN